MSLTQTKAATILQDNPDELTSHQIISLLMDGALERVSQAQTCLEKGNQDDADILIVKLVGIINGLRASLNLEAGGEIATNLNALYDYMVERLGESDGGDVRALAEVQQLIDELKAGWDGISSNDSNDSKDSNELASAS